MRINPSIKKNIKVRLHLSRTSGGRDSFRFSIEDDSSRCTIAEIELDAQAVADLVSARLTEPMPAEYYPNDKIGKIHECKVVLVDLKELPGVFESFRDDARERDLNHVFDRAEELNPGWTADRESTYNSHRRSRGRDERDTYRVTLRRYISQE